MVNTVFNTSELDAFMKMAVNWQTNGLLDTSNIKLEMQDYMNNSGAMNMYKKRERTQNWNHQEKKFLLELCKKDMQIVENKRLDAGLTAVKNKAWKIIHQKFCMSFGNDRTCNRLKEQWRRMKACTRNEIMDYNNRLSRFGPEVANQKKPSPFTFEIWEFMQEAKKACKSEALDGVDYSKIPLNLEEDFELKYNPENDENDENDESSRTPPQDLCNVSMKEEEDTHSVTMENSHHMDRMDRDRLSSASPHLQIVEEPQQNAQHEELTESHLHHQQQQHNNFFQPDNMQFNLSNIAATLETLGALRGQFPGLPNGFSAASPTDSEEHKPKRRRTSSDDGSQKPSAHHGQQSPELKVFMEMQAKEHFIRMKILETQLQAAKFNRDIVEINKTIALQKLQEFATKRLS
ncbi:hypothetical protein ACFFRR_008492 [Megaselia abdita]